MLRRLGPSLLTVLVIASFLAAGLVGVRKATAVRPTPDSGYSITATMIDQNHIWVQASGQYNDGSGNVDVSTVGGMYYNGEVTQGTFRYIQGGDKKVGVSNPSCARSEINLKGQPSYYALPPTTSPYGANFNFYIDPHGGTSTSSSNQCVNLNLPDQTVANPQLGFSPAVPVIGPATANLNVYGGSIGTYDGNDHNTKSSTQYTGEVAFYSANSTTIDSTEGDLTYDNAAPKAEFDQNKNVPTEFDRKNGGDCPDFILISQGDPVTGDGTVERVAYYNQEASKVNGHCGGQSAPNWYELMLVNTPTNTAGGTTNGSGSGSNAPGATPDTCPITTWGLRWLACPLIDGISSSIKLMGGLIQGWLITDTNKDFDNSKSDTAKNIYQAWNAFRVLAISMVVISGLVMVVSEAFGLDMVSAYTIRKVLPRIIIYTIIIELSWVGMRYVAQFSNNLSFWVADLITAPFSHMIPNGVNFTTVVAQYGTILGAFSVLGIAGILSFIATAFLTFLALYLTLLIRQAILIGIFIIMPFALALMILPGTKKYGKMVIDEYWIVQVAIPILFAMALALGQVMNVILSST